MLRRRSIAQRCLHAERVIVAYRKQAACSLRCTSTTTKAPWGLTERYARHLPPARFDVLPDYSPLGVLDKAAWQRNEDLQCARNFLDPLITPRDEYITDLMSRVTVGDEAGSASTTTSKVGPDQPEADKSTGAVRRRSRSGAGASSTIPNSEPELLAASQARDARRAAHRAANASSGDESIGTRRESWTMRGSGSSKAIRQFLEVSTDVFRSTFIRKSSGHGQVPALSLPGIHRVVDDNDRHLFHPEIIAAFESAAKISSTAQQKTPLSAHRRIVDVKKAAIVDSWCAWDETLSDSDITDREAVASQVGHSAVIESSSVAEGSGGLLLRLARRFFHYYQLKPVRRVHAQVTVAYLCELEGDTAASDQAGLEPKSCAVASATTSAGPSSSSTASAKAVGNNKLPHTNLAVHTVTFEAQARVAHEVPWQLLRFALPQKITLESGWRIVDVDGHWAEKEGHTNLTFSSLIPAARDLSFKTARLEMQDAVDAVHEEIVVYQHMLSVATTIETDFHNVLKQLHSTPGGRQLLDVPSPDQFEGRSINDISGIQLAVNHYLKENADDLSDAVNSPPWKKRLAREIADEAAGKVWSLPAVEQAARARPLEPPSSTAATSAPQGASDAAASAHSNAESTPFDISVAVRAAIHEYPAPIVAVEAVAEDGIIRSLGIAAYVAMRGRLLQSMGEIGVRRTDVFVLYELTSRMSTMVLVAVVEQCERYLVAAEMKRVLAQVDADRSSASPAVSVDVASTDDAQKEAGATSTPAASSPASASVATSSSLSALEMVQMRLITQARVNAVLAGNGATEGKDGPLLVQAADLIERIAEVKASPTGNHGSPAMGGNAPQGSGRKRGSGAVAKDEDDDDEEEEERDVHDLHPHDPQRPAREEFVNSLHQLFVDTEALLKGLEDAGVFAQPLDPDGSPKSGASDDGDFDDSWSRLAAAAARASSRPEAKASTTANEHAATTREPAAESSNQETAARQGRLRSRTLNKARTSKSSTDDASK